jgi:hypothetical protein
VTVLAALDDAGATLDGAEGTVVAATDRRRLGEVVAGGLSVSGWEAVVVAAPVDRA